MDFLIFNARVLTDNGVLENGSIFVKSGKIAGISGKPVSGLGTYRLIDAGGCFASPGFIDMQVYGDPKKVSYSNVMFGTTGFLATVSCSGLKTLAVKTAVEAGRSGTLKEGAKVLGVNLEGPYLNRAAAGAQDKRSIKRPDLEGLRALIGKTKGCLKLMTIAPEIKGSGPAIKLLVSKGVIASIGHTNASFEETGKAIDLGASCATHVFNAMGKFHHRAPGAIGAAIDDERVNATVILDGEHVSPPAFRLLLKCKGTGKLILITDSLRDDETFPAKWDGKVYRLKDGTIAGSGLTMIDAVKNATVFGGIPVHEAVRMASENPARMLGLKKKGRLKPGFDADITVFDSKYDVWLTMVGGRIVYKRCAA
ncbi:MAG: N-acetylglucosamine-6-phosphate deacetylase [Candidatus Omnitrophota bacterium]|jgi:N-acetylglucosamine-6-phosphate deacetylase